MAPNAEFRKESVEEFYDIKEELGKGHFAVVKRCLCKKSNNEVAAKFIKIKKNRTSKVGTSRDIIEREAGILSMLDYSKVIKLYEVFDLGTEIVLMLELVTGGELFEKLCEDDYLTEQQACDYMKQVLQGMTYLHSKNVLHLDIKPENIVLKSRDSTDIKLVDFGLAQVYSPNKEIKEMMGTAEFVAPEIVNYERIGFYTDMWAVGVLAYILLTGESPFLGETNQETYDNICNVAYDIDEDFFEDITEDAKTFVKELLVKTPSKRPSASDCLDHRWVKSMSSGSAYASLTIVINTTKLKAFVARRKWQESMKKMKAIHAFSAFSVDKR